MTIYNVRRFGLKTNRYNRNGMWFEIGHKKYSIYQEAYSDYENDRKKIHWAIIDPENLFVLKLNDFYDETTYPYVLYLKLTKLKMPTEKEVDKFMEKSGGFDNKKSADIEKKDAILLRKEGYDGAYFQLIKKMPGSDDQIFYLGKKIRWVK